MAASRWFTDVEQIMLERRVQLSCAEFVGHLSTISAHLLLPVDQRTEVLSKIGSVLPDRVDIVADLTLHLARRSDVD